MMKVYYNESNSNLKATLRKKDGNVIEVVVYQPSESGEYVESGHHAVRLHHHTTYSVLWSDGEYFVRGLDNVQYKSRVKIIPTNNVTLGSRMKFEEAENRYGGLCLIQIDTNTIHGEVCEFIVQLFRVRKDNVAFEGMEPEFESLNIKDVFKKGSMRHAHQDTYSLTVDGVECKADEHEKSNLATIKTDGREFIEMTVRKYTNAFETALMRDDDCEDVFIECTGGITNCQRVKLKNGVGSFRWYPLGFKGQFKIKLGWKFYSGRADVILTAE